MGRGRGILRWLFLAALGAQPVREVLPAAADDERQDLASVVFLCAVCPSRCVGSAVPTLLSIIFILKVSFWVQVLDRMVLCGCATYLLL